MKKKLTESGAKAYQRNDNENRIKQYSDWHRTLDKDLLMLDVDFIEWSIKNGELIPVGVMEVTRVDKGKEVNQQYLDAITSRYEERDLQARATTHVARKLNTKAWIILFREGCEEFWVYNLSNNRGWWHLQPTGMVRFLKQLRGQGA